MLLLRFMLDLRSTEIAAILDLTPSQVRGLQSRALRFLRERLIAVGREPGGGERPRMRRWAGQAVVLRRRRFVLTRRG